MNRWTGGQTGTSSLSPLLTCLSPLISSLSSCGALSHLIQAFCPLPLHFYLPYHVSSMNNFDFFRGGWVGWEEQAHLISPLLSLCEQTLFIGRLPAWSMGRGCLPPGWAFAPPGTDSSLSVSSHLSLPYLPSQLSALTHSSYKWDRHERALPSFPSLPTPCISSPLPPLPPWNIFGGDFGWSIACLCSLLVSKTSLPMWKEGKCMGEGKMKEEGGRKKEMQ